MAPKSLLSVVGGNQDQKQKWEKDSAQELSPLWTLQVGEKGWYVLHCQKGATEDVCGLWGGPEKTDRKELTTFSGLLATRTWGIWFLE